MLRKYHVPTVAYIAQRPALLERLVFGYGSADTALTCGTMLRECLRYEELHILVAKSEPMFQKLVEFVQLPNFEVATDAFSSFKDLMALHKTRQFAEWIENSYEVVRIHRAFAFPRGCTHMARFSHR